MANRVGNKKFTFIDLFAGIGGVRIAFERVGAECVFASEWNKAAQDSYEANFGERPAGDITKISADQIPNHDILTGGFPCQTFSIIGSMKGFAETRGTMFFEIERILRAKEPRAFLLENVRNLTAHDGGRTFKIILDKLQGLGYYVHHKVLNGLNFGVPQKRDRVIIVGFKENYPFKFPSVGLRKALKLEDILEPDELVDKKHFLSDSFRSKVEQRLKEQGKRIVYRPVIMHENKAGNLGLHPFSCALRANASHNYLVVNGTRRLTPREMLRLQGFPDSYKIVGTDSEARKQAGNSVVIPKIESVAKAMLDAMQKEPVRSMQQRQLFNIEPIWQEAYA